MYDLEMQHGIHLRTSTGSSGLDGTLLLLHGAGADGEVWNDLVEPLTGIAGKVLVPDLPGHGRSSPLYPYGIGSMAAQVSRLFEQDEHISIVGHSLGGAVAIAMAANLYGIVVDRVFAIDVKLTWSMDEVAKGRELASKPARIFETEEAAIERYLKVSGLYGLLAPASPAAKSGIVEDDGGYRLRADAKANAIAGTSVVGLAALMSAPLNFLIGTRGALMSPEEMRSLDPDGRILQDCGHNVHVERPDLVAEWIRDQWQMPRKTTK